MPTKGERHRARLLDRTRKTLEKYQGKLALIEEWERIDPEYCRRLKAQAHNLRETLIHKGIL